jgi:hypothetical protein
MPVIIMLILRKYASIGCSLISVAIYVTVDKNILNLSDAMLSILIILWFSFALMGVVWGVLFKMSGVNKNESALLNSIAIIIGIIMMLIMLYNAFCSVPM